MPNQRLVEADLSEEFEASRAAVRESLRELAGEGLIERVANRGSRVRAVDFDEAVEIAEVRLVLESLCAGKAAMRVSGTEIKELKEIGATMKRAVEAGHREAYGAANKKLHNMIYDISGQETAKDMIHRLRAQNVRQQFKLAQKPGRADVSVHEHLAIIDAIASRDREAAEAAMTAHLSSVIGAMHKVQAESEARDQVS